MSAALALQSLQVFADDLEADLEADPNFSDSPEALAIVIDAIDKCRADLAALRRKTETALLAVAPGREFPVDGFDAPVQVYMDKRRTAWDWDLMLSAIIARVMDEPTTLYDEETGELLPYAVVGERLGAKIRSCVGFSYGKVTGLKALGLDAGRYCEEHEGTWKVRMPKRSEP